MRELGVASKATASRLACKVLFAWLCMPHTQVLHRAESVVEDARGVRASLQCSLAAHPNPLQNRRPPCSQIRYARQQHGRILCCRYMSPAKRTPRPPANDVWLCIYRIVRVS
jgi:hypothetical protein